MPGRPPGPLCGTTAERIDSGTNCRHASPRPAPLGTTTREAAPADRKVTFASLWEAYPSDKPYTDKNGKVPEGYENQCAIKVSVALIDSGVPLAGFAGHTVKVRGKPVAARAQELAEWLKNQSPKLIREKMRNVTGSDWESKAKGKKGLIYFEDYWIREGQKTPTGDHIDLWNGSRLTASGLEGAAVAIMRFGLGISSGPGFSDLAKSKKILLWEIE